MKLLMNTSIRRASVIGVAILVTAIAVLSWTTFNAIVELRTKQTEVAGLNMLGDLSSGVVELSLERSVTQLALNLAPPVTTEFRAQIDAQRVKSANRFAAVAAQLDRAGRSPSLKRLHNEFIRLQGEVARLRSVADIQLAMPSEQRDKAFIDTWPIRVPELVRDIEGLRFLLNEPTAHLTFQARAMLDLGRGAWRVREQGGRERTWMAIGAYSRQPLSEANLDFMKGMSKEASGSNTGMKQTVAVGGVPAPVMAAFDTLQQAYFGTYATLREQMYAAAGTGDYPLAGPDFMARSEAALKTAEALTATATGAAIALMIDEEAAAQRSVIVQIGCVVALTAGLVWLAWFLRVRVATRLQKITEVTRQLASGRLDQELERFTSADEVGQLAAGIAVLRDDARERVRLEAVTSAAHAERERRAETLARLAEGFSGEVRAVLDGVAQASAVLRDTASSLSAGACEAAAEADAVSGSAGLASANVQTAAAAAEQLSSSIQEITRQIGRSATIANQAVTEAVATTEAVTELAGATARINDVVRLISDIAGRTNLLALNATIEAARAGDAGKGFAVVASEVKSLATQTARATDDIAGQISAMQGVAERAVSAIRRIDGTIGSMNEISTSIAASMEEQRAATAEIARNVVEAASSTTSMTGRLATVTATVARSTDASTQVLTAAERTAASAREIQARVDRYFQDMNAA